jgi:hypothetical protein
MQFEVRRIEIADFCLRNKIPNFWGKGMIDSDFSCGYLRIDFWISAISEARANKICVKSCSICDLENFNFFDFERARTRQNDVLGQSDIVHIRNVKPSVPFGVWVPNHN